MLTFTESYNGYFASQISETEEGQMLKLDNR